MEQQETTTSTTTPSPVPPAAAAAAASAAAQPASVATAAAQADVFPSPPRSQPTSLGHQPSAPPVRILGRNVNGTVVQTSMPQNEAELQLYRVMQRASLLSYYDTLLEMGGDDVQQLCDAGEEEFLEIMALVGMASKPLHVRRLQKALQEWLTNPAMFQTPVLAPPSATGSGSSSGSKTPVVAPVVFPCIGSYSPNTRQQIQSSAKLHTAAATPPIAQPLAQFSAVSVATAAAAAAAATASCCPVQRRKSLSPQPFAGMQQMQQAMSSQSQQAETPPAGAATVSTGAALLQGNLPLLHSPGIMQTGNYESSSCGSQGTTPSPSSNNAMVTAPQSPTAVLQQSPILLESQVQRLAEAAERLAATIRPLNPKPQSGIKKKMCKNLELVMAMPDSDPRRMEEIRKYAAIYGRFDCKRKPEKPLTLHEVSVNEAAAQICRFVPALLTRRDELFPLARRVVRDSGHYYTKNMLHSASNTPPRTMSSRENGDGDLSGGDEASILTGTAASDLVKRRKLELRCEDDSVAGNRDNSAESGQQQQQAESTRLRSSSYSRTVAIDSDSNSLQLLQNRHRKRQRRRRPSKLGRKSISSPVWQSCSESSNIVLDGVGDDFEDSDGCYSSFDDWDDCNEDDCEENFGIDTDEGGGDDGDENTSTATPMIHDSQNQEAAEQDDPSCMMDKENDFNLKVIASCGDNIIAVANPALMNRNQSAAITKEPPIKEEITLRDRRD